MFSLPLFSADFSKMLAVEAGKWTLLALLPLGCRVQCDKTNFCACSVPSSHILVTCVSCFSQGQGHAHLHPRSLSETACTGACFPLLSLFSSVVWTSLFSQHAKYTQPESQHGHFDISSYIMSKSESWWFKKKKKKSPIGHTSNFGVIFYLVMYTMRWFELRMPVFFF